GQPRSLLFPPLEPLSHPCDPARSSPSSQRRKRRRTCGLPTSNPGSPQAWRLPSGMLPSSAGSSVCWALNQVHWALFVHLRPANANLQKPTFASFEMHHPDRPSSRCSALLLTGNL
ncbi:hypothetical protein CCMA1212_009472, partial [Trichoderma ghanense]